jgi:T4 RnlA family RNA ligase
MPLQDYLTKYYTEPLNKEEFSAHFLDKFGVDVRYENDLVLFKYNMLCAKWSFELVHECRGHIWRHNSDGSWVRVCNPPSKFFNLMEGNCPLFNKEDFNNNVPQLQLISKEDGSLLTVWWDSTLNDWRASTSGSITPFKVGDYDITFSELFWKLLGEDKKSILTSIGKQFTFCFELCSAKNRIVSQYSTDRIYLLLVRHNEYGTYLVPSLYHEQLGVYLPRSFFLYELEIKTQEDLVRWVEDNTTDDADCKYKEGYVGYISGKPIFKAKCQNYLSRHKFSGGDVGATRNNIIEVFFSGCLDDYYDALVDSMKLFADKLKEKAIILNQKVNAMISEMKGKSFPTQKDYALYVLANVDKTFSSFFFANKEKILSGEITNDDFVHWLKVNQSKFESHWKGQE